ncbi:hypothetical protein DDT91_19725 [Algoriphagus sp. AK58]|nr:hypothetical protein [Algoriphagus sp. AK58]
MTWSMSAKKLSIIIPSLNRQGALSQLVKKLVLLSTSETELIIVDDSLDRCREVELASTGSSVVYYIHRGKKQGVSSARNLGAQQAQGDYLVFLDDDDDFTENWIPDFVDAIKSSPTLVFCEMRRIAPTGQEQIEKARIAANGNLLQAIFIPGAWVIKSDFFWSIGGYDERLTYAENTELFIRIQKENLQIKLIPKPNFIYYPSPDGGSKNLRNMVESLNLILDKHQASLSAHVKHLYHQILGVNHMRFREFSKSRKNLILALYYKPTKLATLGRFLIACFPFIARQLYTETVKDA